MNDFSLNNHALITAIEAALAGDWEKSHNITQEYDNPTANWLHAVLHKIEGDIFNSNYWYARTNGKNYADFSDANTELKFILNTLK
jgi:hypothetical protein